MAHFPGTPGAAAVLATALALPGAAAADSGLFVAGAFTYGWVDDSLRLDEVENADDLRAELDDQSTGYTAGVGWRLNNWLSVDAGYWDFGDFKSDRSGDGQRENIESSAYTVGGMVSVPLWLFDVYARGGAALWEADADRLDDDGTDLYYGVGGALNLFSSFDIYLEWVRFDLQTELDTANLGLRYTF